MNTDRLRPGQTDARLKPVRAWRFLLIASGCPTPWRIRRGHRSRRTDHARQEDHICRHR